MRETLDELLRECEVLHGHMCAGQILGARMSLLGCRLIEIEDPRGADRKKLIVWVEIDRCLTDAISAVTGVRLGRRSLKHMNYGKAAATFLNTVTGHAIRVTALEGSRTLADSLYSEIESSKERQLRAYREVSDRELFKVEQVRVEYREQDEPGRPKSRVMCEVCREGINDGREVVDREGHIRCQACVSGGYYTKI